MGPPFWDIPKIIASWWFQICFFIPIWGNGIQSDYCIFSDGLAKNHPLDKGSHTFDIIKFPRKNLDSTRHSWSKLMVMTFMKHYHLGGSFKYCLFSPLFGEDSHFDYSNIFQICWFNHQPEKILIQPTTKQRNIPNKIPENRRFQKLSPHESMFLENGLTRPLGAAVAMLNHGGKPRPLPSMGLVYLPILPKPFGGCFMGNVGKIYHRIHRWMLWARKNRLYILHFAVST